MPMHTLILTSASTQQNYYRVDMLFKKKQKTIAQHVGSVLKSILDAWSVSLYRD